MKKFTQKRAKMTKKELFLILTKPDINGVSRWVSVGEFVGDYESLKIGNGDNLSIKELRRFL